MVTVVVCCRLVVVFSVFKHFASAVVVLVLCFASRAVGGVGVVGEEVQEEES